MEVKMAKKSILDFQRMKKDGEKLMELVKQE
jgi:hypothetical protein